jgi:hypothetical protein
MEKRTPVRTCIGCGVSKEKSAFIRIVYPAVTENGVSKLRVDGKCYLKGRGAYICACLSCFDRAVKRKAFSRSFRRAFADDEINVLSEEFIKILGEAS